MCKFEGNTLKPVQKTAVGTEVFNIGELGVEEMKVVMTANDTTCTYQSLQGTISISRTAGGVLPSFLPYIPTYVYNFSGYAESTRYILHYTGKTFEDDRIDRKQWPIKEKKEALPFGKMPVYEENGKVLHQSIAIARYVAAGTELLPSDPWEQAQLDALVLTLYDFNTNHVAKVSYEPDPVKREEALQKLLNEDLDYYFSRFEKTLKDNNGYFGGKLSWADFVFVAIIEAANSFLKTSFEKNYPTLKKLVQEIPTLPGVKEYVAKRKPYVYE